MLFPGTPAFSFKRGDHFCVFYSQDDALLAILIPYLAQGLRAGERCFCAQRPEVNALIIQCLDALGLAPDKLMKRGALELHTQDEVYFPNGRFEPHTLMGLLEQSIDDAVSRGFAGFRTAGELSWAADQNCDCDQLVAYERMVESAYPKRPAVGMCQYPVSRFDKKTLRAVLDSHRISLTETMATSNHSALSMRHGDYVADIVADRLNPRSSFYWVVQHALSPDILAWGAAHDFDLAAQEAEQVIRDAAGYPAQRAAN